MKKNFNNKKAAPKGSLNKNNMDFQAMLLCSIDHILRSAGLPVPESHQDTACLGSIFCHFLISYRTGFFTVQIPVVRPAKGV